MTYLQFKKNNDIDILLKKLSVLDSFIKNFTLSFHPDFESTDYEGYSTKDYVFFEQITFEEEYFSIIKSSIIDYGFIGVADEGSKQMFPDSDTLEKNLGEEAYFKKLNLIGIDNINKQISLYGAYRGDGFTMSEMMPVDPVAKLALLTIPKDIEQMSFYYRVLAESRLFFQEKKIKLAFFTAFSAFDLFINEEEKNRGLIKYDDKGDVIYRRLEEQLKDIYKNALQIDNLGKDEIWSQLLVKFKNFEDIRNNIAHGRDISCQADDYKELIIVITAFILSIRNSVNTFEKIDSLIVK